MQALRSRHDDDENVAAIRRGLKPVSTSSSSTTSSFLPRSRRVLGEVTNAAASGTAGLIGKISRPTVEAVEISEHKDEDMISAGVSGLRLCAVDEAAKNDPQACTEYIREIFQNYRNMEVTRAVSPKYMASQTDITEKMRAILIDWLVEVALKYKLEAETLFLTINIIDRYLEKKAVMRQKLQLVGVSAMLIASKYEEIYAPEIRDFVYITDHAYTAAEILQMESSILNALSFRLSVPTAFTFLNRYTRLTGSSDNIDFTMGARYCAERCLQEYAMLKYLPSTIAAAATHIAMRMVLSRSWDESMSSTTSYSESALRPCINDMLGIMRGSATTTLQAVRKKYTSPKYSGVTRFTLPADI